MKPKYNSFSIINFLNVLDQSGPTANHTSALAHMQSIVSPGIHSQAIHCTDRSYRSHRRPTYAKT